MCFRLLPQKCHVEIRRVLALVFAALKRALSSSPAPSGWVMDGCPLRPEGGPQAWTRALQAAMVRRHQPGPVARAEEARPFRAKAEHEHFYTERNWRGQKQTPLPREGRGAGVRYFASIRRTSGIPPGADPCTRPRRSAPGRSRCRGPERVGYGVPGCGGAEADADAELRVHDGVAVGGHRHPAVRVQLLPAEHRPADHFQHRGDVAPAAPATM